jgi:hypothetical protein
VHLLEGAQEELSKPASEVSRPRLRSLLELAARTSSVASDPRLDNLKYTFDARGLAQLVVAALTPAAAGSEPVRGLWRFALLGGFAPLPISGGMGGSANTMSWALDRVSQAPGTPRI